MVAEEVEVIGTGVATGDGGTLVDLVVHGGNPGALMLVVALVMQFGYGMVSRAEVEVANCNWRCRRFRRSSNKVQISIG